MFPNLTCRLCKYIYMSLGTWVWCLWLTDYIPQHPWLGSSGSLRIHLGYFSPKPMAENWSSMIPRFVLTYTDTTYHTNQTYEWLFSCHMWWLAQSLFTCKTIIQFLGLFWNQPPTHHFNGGLSRPKVGGQDPIFTKVYSIHYMYIYIYTHMCVYTFYIHAL